jgi:hypothetical protein
VGALYLQSVPIRWNHLVVKVKLTLIADRHAGQLRRRMKVMRNITRCIGLAVGALLFVSVTAPAYAGGGANNSGPYDANVGYGLPSNNGNGQGNAYGKPAAGTVGKADAKNPPGQLPGPEDFNNGYECDGNSGIARGNPAHSSCEGTK